MLNLGGSLAKDTNAIDTCEIVLILNILCNTAELSMKRDINNSQQYSTIESEMSSVKNMREGYWTIGPYQKRGINSTCYWAVGPC